MPIMVINILPYGTIPIPGVYYVTEPDGQRLSRCLLTEEDQAIIDRFGIEGRYNDPY